MDEIILTAKEMLQTFKISRQTLSRWTEKGCPRIEKGKYPLAGVIEWRDKVLFGDTLDAFKKARLRKEEAKALREELKAKQEEGSLIPKDRAVDWIVIHISNAKVAFLGQGKRLAPILALMTDPKEIQIEIDKDNFRILTELADAKKKWK